MSTFSTQPNAKDTRHPHELAEVDASALTEHGDMQLFDYTDPLGQAAQGVLMRWNGQLVAYRNRCPHWGIALNRLKLPRLDSSQRYLLCPAHGALFRPEDGQCIAGPPCGHALERFAVVRITDDDAQISAPHASPNPGGTATRERDQAQLIERVSIRRIVRLFAPSSWS